MTVPSEPEIGKVVVLVPVKVPPVTPRVSVMYPVETGGIAV